MPRKRNRFMPGARFQILNDENQWFWYELNQVLSNESFAIVRLDIGITYIETKEKLIELFIQHKLRFER